MKKLFSGRKQDAVDWIEENKQLITDISDRIWLYAEPALKEYRSAKLHANTLGEYGFDVRLGVPGLGDTSFVATYGSGSPVLATYVEYDAVEGTSQMPVPYKQEVMPRLPGCYDMHHGLGAGALGAAIATKEVMEKYQIAGTLKVFGCPAEKNALGKNLMERAGMFDDLDACVGWHPTHETGVETLNYMTISSNNHTRHTFTGASVYNALPWGGNNAYQAAQLMDIAVNYVKDSIVHIHEAPVFASIFDTSYADYGLSSVPGNARLTYVTRALKRKDNEEIQKRIFTCANAAAMALGVEVKNEVVTGTWEPIPNFSLAETAFKNIEIIGVPKLTENDIEYVQEIYKSLGQNVPANPLGEQEPVKPGSKGYSHLPATGDSTIFSYKCPNLMISTNYLVYGWPDWATATLGLTNIAHQSILSASKMVATTLLDLFEDQTALKEAKEEFYERTKDIEFYNPVPEDREFQPPAPLPDSHYHSVLEAFKRGPKWNKLEPELSERLDRIGKSIEQEIESGL